MNEHNGGLRKICGCPRGSWATCRHSWHFNFKVRNTKTPDSTLPDGTMIKGEITKGKAYQFSLDRHAGKHIKTKDDAKELAADIIKAIRAGTFGAPAPALDQLTLGQLLDTYRKRHVEIERKDSLSNVIYQIGTIKRIEIEQINGRMLAFGTWRVADVTVDALDSFKEARTARGVAAANRDLSLLRAVFNWAIRKKAIKESPFKLGTETVVTLSEEHPRDRRLRDGEEEALLAVCSPHLRAIVTTAIDTGMRRGEILSLQWEQVLGMKIEDQVVTWAPGEATHLFLPHTKTKTRKGRKIPISPRVRSLLEMRRFDPAGNPHAPDAHVFGTAIGGRLVGFQRAWHTAVLKSHGHTPAYSEQANLLPESRAALKAINLHFHDLRREAGSRWMDGALPLATIQRWLGHSNIAQTSIYLAATDGSDDKQMEAYQARVAAFKQLVTDAGSGGHGRPQSDQEAIETTNEIAVGSDTRIM